MPTPRVPFAAPGGRVFVPGDEVDPRDPVIVGREHLFDGAPRVLERTKETTKQVESPKPRKRAAKKSTASTDD